MVCSVVWVLLLSVFYVLVGLWFLRNEKLWFLHEAHSQSPARSTSGFLTFLLQLPLPALPIPLLLRLSVEVVLVSASDEFSVLTFSS